MEDKCKHCNGYIDQRATGRKPLYCSDKCRVYYGRKNKVSGVEISYESPVTKGVTKGVTEHQTETQDDEYMEIKGVRIYAYDLFKPYFHTTQMYKKEFVDGFNKYKAKLGDDCGDEVYEDDGVEDQTIQRERKGKNINNK